MPDFAKQYEMMYEEQLLKIRVADLIPEALAAYDAELRRRGTPECQRKLAEPGFACAQFNLGVAYDRGKGVPQDYVQAAVWYRKAAEQGFASAQLNLGAAYYEGQGVTQDFAQAAAWYRKAAEQGDATAQFNLGAAYCDGQGAPQDNAEAYFWLNLAASGKPEGIRVEEVVRMRDEAASHLTGVALIQTQERARKATEEHFSASVGDNARAPKTDVAKRSRWPSVVGWILIVIGVWGGLQKLTTGEGNLNTTLVTIALFLAGGIGLLRRSGKFAGIGIALVLLVGIIAGLIVGPPRVQTVAETLAGSCGIDESGKAKILKPFNTDGVVTYVSRNDSAYTSVYLLEDATGVMVVVPSKKLPMPSVNDRIKVLGLPNCPPPGATSGPIFSEAFRNPGKMAPDTASKLVSSRAAMMKGKRPVFPTGIFIGLGLTIWSCIRQRELHIAFADFVRLQRSGRS